MGSPGAFPLVMTSTARSSSKRRWWSGACGSMTPRYALRGATSGEIGRAASRLFLRRTTGADAPLSSRSSSALTSAISRATSSDRHMRANGFAGRRLRSRSARTAASFAASAAMWKPPSPFTATMRPAFRRARVRSAASPPFPRAVAASSGQTSSSRGPHTGHAFGCAWKRRSSGSSYSAWHRGHIVNARMDVRGLSYGVPSMMENRGPQFVQLMNG